jgi:cell division protein FtsZ
MPAAAMPRGAEPVSEYAKRPPHQGVDPLARPAPMQAPMQAAMQKPVEEDQLDIPAFLRRQAN